MNHDVWLRIEGPLEPANLQKLVIDRYGIVILSQTPIAWTLNVLRGRLWDGAEELVELESAESSEFTLIPGFEQSQNQLASLLVVMYLKPQVTNESIFEVHAHFQGIYLERAFDILQKTVEVVFEQQDMVENSCEISLFPIDCSVVLIPRQKGSNILHRGPFSMEGSMSVQPVIS